MGLRCHRALIGVAAIAGFTTIASITPAAAQTLSVLYDFPGYGAGYFPRGGLAMDTAGTLYGTTYYGGMNQGQLCANCGTAYKLVPPGPGQTAWSYQLLHTFIPSTTQSGDGIDPVSPLVNFQNTFYGTTNGGGDPMCGCGVVFSITPNGTYTILHTFDPFVPGAGDVNQWPMGATPIGGLLIDTDGTIYGTTSSGGTGALGPDGTNGAGIIFKIDGNGFQKLHDFDGSLNTGPQGMMIFGQDGAIYGTSYGSGDPNCHCGFIFRINKDGSGYQVLYAFLGTVQPGNSHDGANPEGRLALGPDGTIYGTTSFGGDATGHGTAWSIKNVNGSWVYTQLYIFGSDSAASLPHSGLIMGRDGNLYGTGASGGQFGGGAVYRLVPSGNGQWTYQTLYNLQPRSPTGDTPYGDLLYANGTFYGVNLSGGDVPDCPNSPGGCGNVFQLGLHTAHDFNADGKSDILWRDTSGDVAMWLMNGAAVSQSAGVGNAPTTWSIVGQRDFNGDGKADILWHDTAGDVAVWLMSGATVSQSLGVGKAPATWSIAGPGDFFGDGNGDALWRDNSGNVAIWELSGGTVINSCGVGNAPTTWTIAGTGDFDGNGTTDILWRDTSGDVAIWFMSGCTVTQSSGVGNAPTTWSIAGTGDFNGDGKTDILWHDTSGDVAIWFMKGATVSQSSGVGNAPTVWSIAQTGDYFGAGTSDILWTDTSGDVAVWQMNGATVTQSSGVGNAPTVWSIQGAGAD